MWYGALLYFIYFIILKIWLNLNAWIGEGLARMEATKCLRRRLRGGVAVTFDGETKVIPSAYGVPSAGFLGREDVFGAHEHCIWRARGEIERMIQGVMEK
jgi:hypothetical protein